MAFPPATLPTNRTNATPQQDTHPADHNAVNAAVNDITGALTPLVGRRGVGLSQPSQSIPAGTQVALSWPTEMYDTHGFHATGASNIVIPAGLGGLYAITFNVGVGGSGTVNTNCDIVLAVAGQLYVVTLVAGKGGATNSVTIPISAGGGIEARVFNGQSTAQFFNGRFEMNQLRPLA